ncbi:class I SAM-dependent methyltransferase [Mycolicibacterium cosmeticum]|uniref:class I SAM-dependent methyltransferase n=1 Tax=Mycolicibacterium cosmeticum TaxID=258533 RepID=UPI00320461CD
MGSRVIEFGAGNRILERHLHPSCRYVASDLVDRGAGTMVCDLNRRPLPDLGAGTFDVAVLMGVLEYLVDVPATLEWLSRSVGTCVVSYVCMETKRRSVEGLREKASRIAQGWMNHYRPDELQTLFSAYGLSADHEQRWGNNRLFVLSRRVQVSDPRSGDAATACS